MLGKRNMMLRQHPTRAFYILGREYCEASRSYILRSSSLDAGARVTNYGPHWFRGAQWCLVHIRWKKLPPPPKNIYDIWRHIPPVLLCIWWNFCICCWPAGELLTEIVVEAEITAGAREVKELLSNFFFFFSSRNKPHAECWLSSGYMLRPIISFTYAGVVGDVLKLGNQYWQSTTAPSTVKAQNFD